MKGQIGAVADGTSSKLRLLKNAGANVGRGIATGLVALALPAFLVKSLSPESFSVWALVIQIASYLSLLESGLQVAVGRFVAQEAARGDHQRRDAFYHAGLFLLLALAVIGVAGAFGAAALLSTFFPQVPPGQLSDARLALVVVGGSAALSLPASAASGVFIGLERNGIPSAIIGLGRIAQCVVTAITAHQTKSLSQTAIVFSGMALAISAAQMAAVKFFGPGLRLRGSTLTRPIFRELVCYSANLSLWTVSMLLVNGLDLPIVARFEFNHVAAYALTTSLISVFVGLAGVILNVLVPRTSSLVTLNQTAEVRRLMFNATRIASAMVIVFGIPAFFGARVILGLWVGPLLAEQGTPLFRLLLVANSLRMPFMPFALVLMGSGYHPLARLAPITEGITNVLCSLVLASFLGALGVAMGTVIGAFVGSALATFYTMPKVQDVACKPSQFLLDGIGRVLLVALPIVTLLLTYDRLPAAIKVITSLFAMLCSAIIVCTVTLTEDEWNSLKSRISTPRTAS